MQLKNQVNHPFKVLQHTGMVEESEGWLRVILQSCMMTGALCCCPACQAIYCQILCFTVMVMFVVVMVVVVILVVLLVVVELAVLTIISVLLWMIV